MLGHLERLLHGCRDVVLQELLEERLNLLRCSGSQRLLDLICVLLLGHQGLFELIELLGGIALHEVLIDLVVQLYYLELLAGRKSVEERSDVVPIICQNLLLQFPLRDYFLYD